MTALKDPVRSRTRTELRSARQVVTLGLVNNMGDEALKITERQFGGLVSMSAPDIDVQIRLFALKRTPRTPRALEYITAHYEPASSVMDGELDALIITGAQPHATRLSDEPYWEELIELIEWAKEHTASTILSCLAAHAGVLYLDGVERRPLPEKCTGVFAFQAHGDHPLVSDQGRARLTPHSRFNTVLQGDLERAGYDVLTSSPVHGVDSFTKSFGSQLVFLQGHPEYDADSLAREYRRDIDLYLRGETDRSPARPKDYFTAEAELELRALERHAHEDPRRLAMGHLSKIDALAPTEAPWRDAAISFYRGWIETVATATRRRPSNAAETVLPTFQSVSERNDTRALRRSARHDGESNLGRLSNGVEVCGGIVSGGVRDNLHLGEASDAGMVRGRR
jgi:homoserine O-succinyltransferase/O-acetyltransferase